MRAIVLFFLVSGILSACGGEHKTDKSGGVSKDKLQIVTSIKPIQAIVLAIAGDFAEVEQLIPDYASPHDYSFKPSDIRKVNNANIVFRIDEHMETQLNGVFQNLNADKTSIVSLADADGLMLLASDHRHLDKKAQQEHKHENEHEEHNAYNEQHDHSHEEELKHQHDKEASTHTDHDKHSNHENMDFHLWTSPKNAVLMANKVATSLSELDSKNADHYKRNIGHFFQTVKTESEKIAEKLAPYKNETYIVFHNSWQYFAEEFGLQKPIVVDIHEGISSGAKTISSIRKRIIDENIKCVFYDSGVSEARLKVFKETVKTVKIDVLAKSIALDQSTYINWLAQLGAQIESCLSD